MRDENARLKSSNGGDSNTEIKALNKMHATKTRSLMKSIAALQQERDKILSENKDNVRTKYIQGLKNQLKTAQLKVDLLKTRLMENHNEKRCI